VAKRTIVVMDCDNPDCDNTQEHNAQSGPALGIFIDKGQWHFEGGGMPLPTTYACSFDCLSPALAHMTREELRR
jgi:hypothetical protein